MLNFTLNNISILSQGLNTLTGGSRFYTFSARSHYCAQVLKLKKWTYIEKGIDLLFFWQKAHCRAEYYYEKNQRSTPC